MLQESSNSRASGGEPGASDTNERRVAIIALGVVLAAAVMGLGLRPLSVHWSIELLSFAALLALGGWLILRASDANARELRRRVGAIEKALVPQGPWRCQASASEHSTTSVLAHVVESAAEVPGLRARLMERDERTESLRSVIDALDVPLLAIDPEGFVEIANPAAGRFLDRTNDALAGRPLGELFTQGAVQELVGRAQAGEAGRAQVKIGRREGPRVYEVQASPVRSKVLKAGLGAGVFASERGSDARLPLIGESVAGDLGEARFGVVLTLADVTELATAVQLKTEFVANASHELRTPLAAIKAAIETMSDVARDDEEMRDKLARMVASNVDRLEELTRDLLDLSRLETPDVAVTRERVDVGRLAETLVQMFESVCSERRVGLDFDVDPALRGLISDPKLLQLILKNLIDNSTKFAYEGTTIRVVGRVTEDRGDRGRRGARFQVVDQGIGIPIASQARVFERFYQVDLSRSGVTPRRGTGLGLAIVKHAVKALGGSVRVESVWTQGTTMTVDLPGCVEPEEREARDRAA